MLTILDKKLKVLPTLCQSPLGWLPLHHYEIAGGIHYVTMLCGWTRDYRVHIQLKRTPSPKSTNPVISGRETARWAKLKLAKLPHKHALHSSECQVLLNHTYHCYRLRKKKKKNPHMLRLFSQHRMNLIIVEMLGYSLQQCFFYESAVVNTAKPHRKFHWVKAICIY